MGAVLLRERCCCGGGEKAVCGEGAREEDEWLPTTAWGAGILRNPVYVEAAGPTGEGAYDAAPCSATVGAVVLRDRACCDDEDAGCVGA